MAEIILLAVCFILSKSWTMHAFGNALNVCWTMQMNMPLPQRFILLPYLWDTAAEHQLFFESPADVIQPPTTYTYLQPLINYTYRQKVPRQSRFRNNTGRAVLLDFDRGVIPVS